MERQDSSAPRRSYYFAYGTYLDSALLAARMPGSAVVGVARAVNRSLQFRATPGDPSRGWCHLADSGDSWGRLAYGVVVSTGPVDSARFADNEARYLTVYGDNGAAYDCWTYCLQDPQRPTKLPAGEWQHIVTGMAEWKFPDAYRDEVSARHEAALDLATPASFPV